MNLAELSIKRPVFIACIVTLMLAVGLLSMKKLGVDLFPDVTFPVVVVTTPYPGAGPNEIETLVSKPIEDEIATISGIKRLSSINNEGVSTVIAEFTLETDVKFAEQQVRDHTSAAKRKLPTDTKESVIRRLDPADQPVVIMSLDADLDTAKMYDLAFEVIKPRLEQINQVGLVEIIGGRRREVRVELDRNKLKSHEVSASQVVSRLSASGEDIPVGTINDNKTETVFRTIGQFKSVKDIERTIVNFFGNDVPVRISDIGKVADTLVDEKSRSYLNGKKTLYFYVFRQSGSNMVAVADAIKDKTAQINLDLASLPGKGKIEVIRDGSVWVRANILDVKESIFIGIALAIVVVFYFLGSGRSTIITGLALPNSLIGAFILMAMAGFTINIMSLLALSLTVGLLIDDAIVVRENIYRHIEMGKDPRTAAIEGTAEVKLAVIATTLCVIAVFGPIGFLKGVTGQFFKQFGLTICFAMMISLFDALTIAPMLSAYFAGSVEKNSGSFWDKTVGSSVRAFERFQTKMENVYERSLHFTLKKPLLVLFISGLIFVGSLSLTKYVPKTFLPPQDAGEFMVSIDLPPGTSLEAMDEVSQKFDQMIRKHPEVSVSSLTVGSRESESNKANFYIKLVDIKQRKMNTSQFKDLLRDEFKSFEYANPKVQDYDPVGAGQRPFNLNIIGMDMKELEKVGMDVLTWLKKHPGLKDVDINFRSGKPEYQISLDKDLASRFGISTAFLGQELRTQVEGSVAAKFRDEGREYDVRVRLQEDQRNLKTGFESSYAPNINNSLVRIANVAKPIETTGLSKITRQDRARYVQISADISPGAGLGNVMDDINHYFATDYKLPQGMRHAFIGQAENMKEMGESMVMAMGLGILFIYLVLASLYESFAIPLTIMLALPLAIVGSFVALFVTGQSLNIFSMISNVMLLGLATKNSILLVDYANQLIAQGMSRSEAIIKSGRTRLRPIMMTTMALIAGTFPLALGLNEASRQRTSMGVAIIGGMISSTLLTLYVVPAAFSYIDRFRFWIFNKFSKSVGMNRSMNTEDYKERSAAQH